MMAIDWDVDFAAVLESAARLQQLVPDAVLVGGWLPRCMRDTEFRTIMTM